jgi:hypothetical protein
MFKNIMETSPTGKVKFRPFKENGNIPHRKCLGFVIRIAGEFF